jgi:hypothetical protein
MVAANAGLFQVKGRLKGYQETVAAFDADALKAVLF